MINETIIITKQLPITGTKDLSPSLTTDDNLEMAVYYILGAGKLLSGTPGRKRILCKAIHYLNNELKTEERE